MKKYEAFQIIEDGKKLKNKTDEPFKWFPELEKMFDHFNIKKMKIEIDDSEVSYVIRKVREHEVPDLSMGGMLRKALSEIDEEM